MAHETSWTVPYPDRLTRIMWLASKLAQLRPKAMKELVVLHEAGATEDSLDTKTKELLALALAVYVRCEGSVAFHAHDALQAGATKEEIHDALGVAILMGGGPTKIYATHVMDALEKLAGNA